MRAKGNVRIRPWLRLNNNMDFTVVDYHQPMLYYSNQLVPRMIEHSGQPVSLITNPDGTWTYGRAERLCRFRRRDELPAGG